MPSATASSPGEQPHRSHRKSTSTTISRASTALHKTEVTINVYDLLPPGRLSSFLWTIGGSLLHSGVVINDREYAYGGHNKRGITGVYWTKPRLEPPGGTFRTAILQGFTFRTETEIKAIIKEVSDVFLGSSYNLLSNNCNHFTSALCEKLTFKSAPAYLNRAASIGLALPCIVPREWGLAPPDHETAEGELVEGEGGTARDQGESEEESSSENDEEEDDDDDEHAGMMESDRRRRRREDQYRATTGSSEEHAQGNSVAGGKRIRNTDNELPARLIKVRDASGHPIPAAERAPVPKKV